MVVQFLVEEPMYSWKRLVIGVHNSRTIQAFAASASCGKSALQGVDDGQMPIIFGQRVIVSLRIQNGVKKLNLARWGHC